MNDALFGLFAFAIVYGPPLIAFTYMCVAHGIPLRALRSRKWIP